VELSPGAFPARYELREAETNADPADRRLIPVSSCDVLGLLATVRVGRIAYRDRALPGIQVVSHVIDGGDIIIRSHGRPPVVPPTVAGNVVLAYEADVIDPETFAGWRVTVTGNAGLIRDPGDVARYHRVLPLWPVAVGTGQLIRLHPGLMGGYRFLGPGGT
jgi:hypothetical protein